MQDVATEVRELRRELRKRDEELLKRDEELRKRDEELLKRDAVIFALHAEVERLRELVTQLQAQLGQNSRNSSKPPSSDAPGSRPKESTREKDKKKKRKRGGQPGRRGKARELVPPDQVDHVEDLYPEHCECCGGSLPKIPDANPQRHQVAELPPIKPKITEHRAHAVTCSCGCTTRAVIPPHVAISAFGPRLASIVATLTGIYHLSRRQAEGALWDFFGVKISLGAISATEERVSKAIAPAVNEAWQMARQAKVKHADGTSWRQAGQALQLWTLATAAVTVFKVVTDGTADTLKKLLGRITGVLISDRASALSFWAMKQRQICWAHLLRRFVAFSERDGPTGEFGRVLLEYTGILFDSYRAWKGGQITHETFQRRMAPLRLQVEAVLERVVQANIKKVSGSCENILVHRQALWTFIDNPEVEPTNNHAERELRKFVLWRKRSFGTQSARGNAFAERIMTVAHTARKQNKPVLAYLTAACEAARFGKPCPSLMA